MGANILIAAYKKFGIGTGIKAEKDPSGVLNKSAKYEYGPNKKGYVRDGRDLDGDGYGEVDCSALVSSALKDAGYNIS
ncbi:MAG: hypothetical protein LWW87_13255, partial [Geobacteraceae bacterium]|nr:hypothetical protein [Geobacteraceae bacterium]